MNTGSAALETMRNRLHISHSQLNLYLTCSVKYYFRYVQRLRPEHRSISLIFGKAIHAALEAFYIAFQKYGAGESLEYMSELLKMYLVTELCDEQKPKVLFDKTIPDLETALKMGEAMLRVFVENENLEGYEIIAIEKPFSVPLINHPDCNLLGVVDLLLLSPDGDVLAVDHKTAKNQWAQASADKDMQMTIYSYLLRESSYADYEKPLTCRFNVFRKLKTPKLQSLETIRYLEDNRRMLKILDQVLQGIEQRIYMPSNSWMCANCEYTTACKKW